MGTPAPWEGDKQELGRIRQTYRRVIGKSPGTMKPEKMLRLIEEAGGSVSAAPEPPSEKKTEAPPTKLAASPVKPDVDALGLDNKTAIVHTVAGDITIRTKSATDLRRFVIQATKRLPIRKHVTVDLNNGRRLVFLPGVGHVEVDTSIEVPS